MDRREAGSRSTRRSCAPDARPIRSTRSSSQSGRRDAVVVGEGEDRAARVPRTLVPRRRGAGTRPSHDTHGHSIREGLATSGVTGDGLPSSHTMTSNAPRDSVWAASAARHRARLSGRANVGMITDTAGTVAFAGRSLASDCPSMSVSGRVTRLRAGGTAPATRETHFKPWAAPRCAAGQSSSRADVQTFETVANPSRTSPRGPSPPTQRRQSDAVRYSRARIPARVRGKCHWPLPPLGAQQANAAHQSAPVPAISAALRTAPISIDGRLDEDAWKQATPITEFRQQRPVEGGAPTLGDRGAHPVRRRGALRRRAHERAAWAPPASARRSPGATSCSPQRQQRLVQLAHHRQDRGRPRSRITTTSTRSGSRSTRRRARRPVQRRPVVGSGVGGRGARSTRLAGPPRCASRTRSSASRATARRRGGCSSGASSTGSTSRTCGRSGGATRAAGPAYFGHLEGIVVDRPAAAARAAAVRRLERASSSTPTPGDPYSNTRDMKLSAGADIKYNLTSNLTLDATINPDFGQVEVDPATLNLSAFETFYEEKRPFFVANRSAFSFGGIELHTSAATSPGSACFYSRRIGRPPQLNGWVGNQAAYVDAPDDATILGAAKITGRTSSGYTVGLLDAVTGPRDGALSSPRPASRELHADRRAADQLLRGPRAEGPAAGRDDGRRRSATSTVRRLRRRLRARPASCAAARARSGSTGATRGSNRTYSVARQRRRRPTCAGRRDAIALTQRSSTHYFQRPDREVTSDGLFSTALRHHRARRCAATGCTRGWRRRTATGCGRPQTELAQPGLRGERHRLPRPHRLPVDERQPRAAVDQAGKLVSQHLRHRRRPAAVQLRRRSHRLRAAGVSTASSS